VKLYHGKKRQAKKIAKASACFYSFWRMEPWREEIFKYLLSAKRGDIIGACTGRNHTIKKIEYLWTIGKTRVLHDIRVTDTEGNWHWFSGSG
jgi:hypothetical protein